MTHRSVEEVRSSRDPSAVPMVARVACDNVERVVVGTRHEVLLVPVALPCRGHVLIEDGPGVGKTVLAEAVARAVGRTFTPSSSPQRFDRLPAGSTIGEENGPKDSDPPVDGGV